MKSQAILCALVVLCCALSVNSNPAATYIKSKVDQSLMNYMMKPRAGAIDPSNSVSCFNEYIPILNGIAETYQKDYEACLNKANEEMAALDEQGAEVRGYITGNATNVCKLFDSCQQKADNLDFFDCFTKLGDPTVREVYSMSQDSSEEAANLRESYRVVKVNSEKCTNETSRVYVTDSANCYADLDDCLINGLKTTTAPAETTTEGDTSTVDDITTTTEASTTDDTTTLEPSTSDGTTVTDETTTETPERDPVEELILTEKSARNRLEAFVRNWNKRVA